MSNFDLVMDICLSECPDDYDDKHLISASLWLISNSSNLADIKAEIPVKMMGICNWYGNNNWISKRQRLWLYYSIQEITPHLSFNYA